MSQRSVTAGAACNNLQALRQRGPQTKGLIPSSAIRADRIFAAGAEGGGVGVVVLRQHTHGASLESQERTTEQKPGFLTVCLPGLFVSRDLPCNLDLSEQPFFFLIICPMLRSLVGLGFLNISSSLFHHRFHDHAIDVPDFSTCIMIEFKEN